MNTHTNSLGAAAFEPFMRLHRHDIPLGDGAATFAGFTPMNDQPGLADRKAMFVLAVSGMLLSTLLFFAPKLHTLLQPSVRCVMLMAAMFTLSTLILAAGRCAYAAYSKAVPPLADNVMFVQNVAGYEYGDFDREVRGHAPEVALRLTLEYSHAMALLGMEKFRLVGRALNCLRVALPIWMLLLLVLGLGN